MPNNDYILRSDALSALSRGSGCENICSNAIKRIPAADVEPRRYAEWISPDVNVVATCSACGTAAPYDVDGDIIMYWPNLNFCPYCGCKMNVEGKNAEVH